MRKKQELNKISSGLLGNKITTTTRIDDPNDLEGLFPSVLDLTLRDALDFLNRRVYCIFEWNDKRNEDGTFDSWDCITHDEWDYIQKNIEVLKSKKKRNNRRPNRHGYKKTTHQRT
jgi:hypothetical protein